MLTKKYSIDNLEGNAFVIMGYVAEAMRKEGRSEEDIQKYYREARSGDYNKLITVSKRIIRVLNLVYIHVNKETTN